ncbi:MAG: zinc ribbon domain-containing protein [Streptosporangiaceae bacterium]|nr:zinc ribbon domain-containing protein [Streptosporangiaceae bacterium]
MAMQTFLTLPSSGNYFDGYEVRQVTGSSLHITRRHVPAWAIAVAIAGSLFFLIGLVALLVRETEVLIITVSQQDEGSYLDFSGTATPRITTTVNLAIDRLLNGITVSPPMTAFPPGPPTPYPPNPYQTPYPPSTPTPYPTTPQTPNQPGPPAPYPPGPPTPYSANPAVPPANTAKSANSPTVKTCPECAETVRAAAKVCRFCNYRFTSESPPPAT